MLRTTYIALARVILDAAKSASASDRRKLGELLMVVNGENAPSRDQDIVDFLTELFLAVTFDDAEQQNSDRKALWEGLRKKHHALRTPSHRLN